jgi:hypothetical protein
MAIIVKAYQNGDHTDQPPTDDPWKWPLQRYLW